MELASDYERLAPGRTHWIGSSSGPRSAIFWGTSRGCRCSISAAATEPSSLQLLQDGAAASVGVDVGGNFIAARLLAWSSSKAISPSWPCVPSVAGRQFDRILFLQSFGYAKDPVRSAADGTDDVQGRDGFILLTRTQPIRYAIERAEQNGTSLGEEYFSTDSFSYRDRNWNEHITLTKRPYTMSDLINVFSAARMWIDATVEPQLSAEVRQRYPHKQAA